MSSNQQTPVVRFYNANKNSWKFPDGEVIFSFVKADAKAKELGMTLESDDRWRFSKSH
ncbi:hypothetical protein [Yersinia aldovae]|uniref:hypothetical protein n=1 Tax=Yersinia aldovae TaxID=29483 RepID=UPI0016437611|nr:hypothetical protein [Yersinia aldovae]